MTSNLHRLEANRSRLQTEISLAFNQVSQEDSFVSVDIAKATRLDSAAMRTLGHCYHHFPAWHLHLSHVQHLVLQFSAGQRNGRHLEGLGQILDILGCRCRRHWCDDWLVALEAGSGFRRQPSCLL